MCVMYIYVGACGGHRGNWTPLEISVTSSCELLGTKYGPSAREASILFVGLFDFKQDFVV